MNLIEKVAELQNLIEKITSGPWKQEDNIQSETQITNSETEIFDDGSSNGEYSENFRFGDPDPTFICEIRNAAPKLLSALGKVQEGDAIAFQFLIDHVDIEDLELWSQCPDLFDLFSRYRDMARLMEDTVR